jgi:dipeptidase E
VERGPREHDCVDERNGDAHCRSGRETLQHVVRCGSVEVELVVHAGVSHGQHHGLALSHKADVGNDALVEDGVDYGALVATPLPFSSHGRARCDDECLVAWGVLPGRSHGVHRCCDIAESQARYPTASTNATLTFLWPVAANSAAVTEASGGEEDVVLIDKGIMREARDQPHPDEERATRSHRGVRNDSVRELDAGILALFHQGGGLPSYMARHIVAIGGVSSEADDSALDRFVLDLAGVAKPRVCFLPTASGDAEGYIATFYALFPASVCEPTHLTLFSPPVSPPAELLAEQDVIYVGGGSTPNLLAIWRLHGIAELLRTAWQRGAVLCGASAGSMCWFESGLTDAMGNGLAPLHDALGFLTGSNCVHYDSDPRRRLVYQELVGAGILGAGYAVDDGAALHFEGTDLAAVISSRRTAAVYRVERDGRTAREHRLQPSLVS